MLLGHTRRDSDAAFEMLMRQWREGAPQSDPCIASVDKAGTGAPQFNAIVYWNKSHDIMIMIFPHNKNIE